MIPDEIIPDVVQYSLQEIRSYCDEKQLKIVLLEREKWSKSVKHKQAAYMPKSQKVMNKKNMKL